MVKHLLLLFCATVLISSFAGASVSALSSSPVVGDVIVRNIKGPTVAQKIEARAKTSWPWFIARGSGIVAGIALILLMLSGIGQITGDTFRFLEPLTAWASHRALGITFAIAGSLHMAALLFDTFVPFNVAQLFIPWLATYKPVTLWGHQFGSLYVALGILAFYLSVIVVATSLVWVEKKPYVWKVLHILSYIIIAFVFIHALYLGTDLAHGVLRLVWIFFGLLIGFGSLYRLWRAKTI